jgi:hypothetical protein
MGCPATGWAALFLCKNGQGHDSIKDMVISLSSMMLKIPVLAMMAFIVSSCGSETDPGPGGVNAGDARALDEAATRLDERQTKPGQGKTPRD